MVYTSRPLPVYERHDDGVTNTPRTHAPRATLSHGRDVRLLEAVHCAGGTRRAQCYCVWPRHSTGEVRTRGGEDTISTGRTASSGCVHRKKPASRMRANMRL